MKKLFFITLFIPISLICTEAKGADWKYFGGVKLPLKNELAISFYDSETVEYLSNGNVRVWIKTVTKSEFEMVTKKKKNQIAEESAKKLVNGYFPPYTLVTPNTSYDDVIDIITWEETAKYAFSPIFKMFSEINCKEKKHRILSTIYFKNDGGVKSNDSPHKWEYISPESNMETLQKILCK